MNLISTLNIFINYLKYSVIKIVYKQLNDYKQYKKYQINY